MRCEDETWEPAANCNTRCILYDGHKGDHTDGCLTWREPTREELDAEYDRLDAGYAALDARYKLGAEHVYGSRELWVAGTLAVLSFALLVVVLSLRAC